MAIRHGGNTDGVMTARLRGDEHHVEDGTITLAMLAEDAKPGEGGGAHPNLAAHDSLGLATQVELDAHDHDAAYSATGHTHNYEAAGSVATHAAASDPHPTYLNQTESDARYSLTGHSHGAQGGEAFPVGAVFIAVVNTNPASLLGYGTWAAFGVGRFLLGTDTTAEQTAGSATHSHSFTQPTAASEAAHTHTYTQTVNHVHVQTVNTATTGGLNGYGVDTSTNTPAASGYSTQNPTGGVATGTTAAGSSHTHTLSGGAVADGSTTPPSITVFMWKRTA
jgi:hypothetical protein